MSLLAYADRDQQPQYRQWAATMGGVTENPSDCVRCNHPADDHRHDDAGCGSATCGHDGPDTEPCRFRCTMPACGCQAMIRDPRVPVEA